MIAPLDTDHARVVGQLSVDLAAALSIDLDDVALRPPHITLASYTGLDPPRAATALAPVLAVPLRSRSGPMATASSRATPTLISRST